MRKPLLRTVFPIPVLALMLWGGTPGAVAQEMEHSAPSPSTHLTIKTYDGKTLTLSPEELAALPHRSVSVFNAHSKANETYSGVPLADLLSKAGVPLGESVRGKLFLTAVVASGVDGYGVLYSLAEVDPSIHTGDVIVADSVDGKKLDKDGAFKMVSSEERRPARWVRNLTSISVVKVEP
jgi:Oxidoreductase molybdopterin binding domain